MRTCGLCGGVAERRQGPSRCADCRPVRKARERTCTACGRRHVHHLSRCEDCTAERLRVAYRVKQGIPLDAAPLQRCDECGDEFGPAANHRTVTMIRRYCSDACRNRAKCRRRRVQRAGRPVERYAAVEVFERDRWVCRLCDEPIDRQAKWPAPKSPSIDHIVPVSLGGADVVANVQAAHFACNIAKSNRMVA